MPRYITVCGCCNLYYITRYRRIWNPPIIPT